MGLIESSDLSVYLGNSVWIYPMVNAGHILGIALLIGSLIPLDLRLLGFWQHVSLLDLSRVLQPVTRTGLVLAIFCGMLLFATGASQYAVSSLFKVKMALVAAGIANALLLSTSKNWQYALQYNECRAGIKAQAFFSLLIWVSVLVLGRLIGYR